jgi:predicted ATPase
MSNVRYTAHIIVDKLGLRKIQIKEDTNAALNIMQDALCFKHQSRNEYIKLISHFFGPALTGMAFWNNNKTTKLVSELLTITDE